MGKSSVDSQVRGNCLHVVGCYVILAIDCRQYSIDGVFVGAVHVDVSKGDTWSAANLLL